MRRLLLAVGLLLIAAPVAYAGGWATVGLSSTPEGTPPGGQWNVNVTVLQHGVTPLEGVKPAITIRNGDATKTFAATPTGKPGVYRASVVFPAAGRWSYEVDDGFISEKPHTFPPVQIGEGGAAATAAPVDDKSGGGPSIPLLAGGLVLLLAAAALLVIRRPRDRHDHQPQAA